MFRKNVLAVLITAPALGLLFSSCESVNISTRQRPVINETYQAVDHLISQGSVDCICSDDGVTPGDRILVGTLVDINDVDTSSMFGRQVAEFVAARLAQNGHRVVQTTLRDGSVVIREDGQFLLSRDTANLSVDYNAKAVVVGTYGVTDQSIFVSLRTVCTIDNSLLGATDFILPLNDQILFMLETQAGGASTW
jgi:hypothetical protein